MGGSPVPSLRPQFQTWFRERCYLSNFLCVCAPVTRWPGGGGGATLRSVTSTGHLFSLGQGWSPVEWGSRVRALTISREPLSGKTRPRGLWECGRVSQRAPRRLRLGVSWGWSQQRRANVALRVLSRPPGPQGGGLRGPTRARILTHSTTLQRRASRAVTVTEARTRPRRPRLFPDVFKLSTCVLRDVTSRLALGSLPGSWHPGVGTVHTRVGSESGVGSSRPLVRKDGTRRPEQRLSALRCGPVHGPPIYQGSRHGCSQEPAAPSALRSLCSPYDPTLAVGVGLSSVRVGSESRDMGTRAGGSFLPRDGPITGPPGLDFTIRGSFLWGELSLLGDLAGLHEDVQGSGVLGGGPGSGEAGQG